MAPAATVRQSQLQEGAQPVVERVLDWARRHAVAGFSRATVTARRSIAALVGHLPPRGRTGERIRRQRGLVLLETVFAIGIVSTAILATLAAISATSMATRSTMVRTTATWVATSQVEYIQQAEYVCQPGTYDGVSTPENFAVSNETEPVDGWATYDTLQKVIVRVSHHDVEILKTEFIKTYKGSGDPCSV